jgi:hypothetical protein
MRITADGTVGIGTANPPEKLHVVSATLAVLGEGGAGIGVNGQSTNGTGVHSESTGGIAIHGISPGGLTGKFAGSVEITGELRVGGAILVGGIPMNAPDHVFENSLAHCHT